MELDVFLDSPTSRPRTRKLRKDVEKESKSPSSIEVYFDKLVGIDLLTAGRELELGKLVAEGTPAEAKAARDELVKANLRLVISVARRYLKSAQALSMGMEDLIQEGNLGLIRAAERYDYRKGHRFSTYASYWIRHFVMRAMQDRGGTMRLPVHVQCSSSKIRAKQIDLQGKLKRPPTREEVALALGVHEDRVESIELAHMQHLGMLSLDAPIPNGDESSTFLDMAIAVGAQPDHDEAIDNESRADKAKRAMRAYLRPDEYDVLSKRLGLGPDGEEMTLLEVGLGRGVSRERIRQIQEKALDKLRKRLGGRRPDKSARIIADKPPVRHEAGPVRKVASMAKMKVRDVANALGCSTSGLYDIAAKLHMPKVGEMTEEQLKVFMTKARRHIQESCEKVTAAQREARRRRKAPERKTAGLDTAAAEHIVAEEVPPQAIAVQFTPEMAEEAVRAMKEHDGQVLLETGCGRILSPDAEGGKEVYERLHKALVALWPNGIFVQDYRRAAQVIVAVVCQKL